MYAWLTRQETWVFIGFLALVYALAMLFLYSLCRIASRGNGDEETVDDAKRRGLRLLAETLINGDRSGALH